MTENHLRFDSRLGWFLFLKYPMTENRLRLHSRSTYMIIPLVGVCCHFNSGSHGPHGHLGRVPLRAGLLTQLLGPLGRAEWCAFEAFTSNGPF
jgi:hypothetical protein